MCSWLVFHKFTSWEVQYGIVFTCFVSTKWCGSSETNDTQDHPSILESFGVSKLRNHQRMIVIDLRGQDRACGAIPGTKNIPAMDLLKEIGKYVKDFEEKQIVAFFCQYSAHRAPTAAGCMCSNTLSVHIYIYYILYILCVFYCFLISRVYHNPSKATLSAGENQSNKVANFFRKSCPSKQRVMILEGGYRGWEAHDLPIQQMEATLSQKACDQLALKIGQKVSKVNWGGLWSAMIGPIIFYGRHSWKLAVSITPGSRPTLLRPQNAEAQRTVRRKIMTSHENQNGQSWLVKVGLEFEGHHKQRPILRRNPSWGRHLFA